MGAEPSLIASMPAIIGEPVQMEGQQQAVPQPLRNIPGSCLGE